MIIAFSFFVKWKTKLMFFVWSKIKLMLKKVKKYMNERDKAGQRRRT